MKTDIKVGSITNAQRAQRILKNHGYRVEIKKLLKTTPADGCGYVVRVDRNADEAIRFLSSNGISGKEVK